MGKIKESRVSIPGYRKVYKLNGQQLGIRLKRGAIHDVLTMEEVATGKEIATANTQSSHERSVAEVAFYLTAAIEKNGRFNPSSPFCRRGITTALTQEAICHLGELGINTVLARTKPDNHRSQGLLKKLGFERADEIKREGEIVWIKKVE